MFHTPGIKKTSGVKVRRLDENDKEIASEIEKFGLSKSAALMLAYLRRFKTAEIYDFEVALGFLEIENLSSRLAKISTVIKELKQRGWINEEKKKAHPEDREEAPIKIFSLKVEFNEIIAELEKQQIKVDDEARIRIERLKGLAK